MVLYITFLAAAVLFAIGIGIVIGNGNRVRDLIKERTSRPVIATDLKGFVRVFPEALAQIFMPDQYSPFKYLTEKEMEELSSLTIHGTLKNLANPETEISKQFGYKSCMTALAAVYDFGIPDVLLDLSPGAKFVYTSLVATMQAVKVEHAGLDDPRVSRDPSWDYVDLLTKAPTAKIISAREHLYRKYFITWEEIIVRVIFEQRDTCLIMPLFPMFMKRLRRAGERRFQLTDDEVKSIVCAIAVKYGLKLPVSYILYSPLTAILMNHDELPDTPVLTVVGK